MTMTVACIFGALVASSAVQHPQKTTASVHKTKFAVGPKLGALMPTSRLDPTYYAAIDMAYRLPAFLPITLGIALEIGTAEPDHHGTLVDPNLGDVSYTLHQRLIVGAVDALAFVPLPAVTLYGGLGWGFYYLRATMQALEQENAATQMRSGLQVRGGAEYEHGPGAWFAELRYHYVALRYLPTGRSNAGGVGVAAGYRFSF